jgi:hypothetical protein
MFTKKLNRRLSLIVILILSAALLIVSILYFSQRVTYSNEEERLTEKLDHTNKYFYQTQVESPLRTLLNYLSIKPAKEVDSEEEVIQETASIINELDRGISNLSTPSVIEIPDDILTELQMLQGSLGSILSSLESNQPLNIEMKETIMDFTQSIDSCVQFQERQSWERFTSDMKCLNDEINSVTSFSPEGVPPRSDSQYDINLIMDEKGTFHVDASVVIRNISNDSWSKLVFYFIPNLFTEHAPQEIKSSLEEPSTVEFHEITLNDEQVKYNLSEDNLVIPLSQKLEPENDVKVDFSYSFTLPENGLRFTKSSDNYHLAQFYPMLATYRDHQWNKESFTDRGESYHTAFSDFIVSYEIPDSYTLVSSSENDSYPSPSKGSFEVNNVKEIFIGILSEPKVIQKTASNIEIRVFGFEEKDELYQEIGEVAADALQYFQDNFGAYPFKQLDIVIDGLGMEYPGIVTAHTIYDSAPVGPDVLKDIVVHEIAHQWFYGVVSNDPYHEAWLDEGMVTFATSLYHFSSNNIEVPYESMYKEIESLDDLPVNLSLDEYESYISSYIYTKSNAMLWKLFEERGGKKEAENFLKTYYDAYQYKEVDSEEFVRFTKHYFELDDDSVFEEWLLLQ